jgi:hypothetical protein
MQIELRDTALEPVTIGKTVIANDGEIVLLVTVARAQEAKV